MQGCGRTSVDRGVLDFCSYVNILKPEACHAPLGKRGWSQRIALVGLFMQGGFGGGKEAPPRPVCDWVMYYARWWLVSVWWTRRACSSRESMGGAQTWSASCVHRRCATAQCHRTWRQRRRLRSTQTTPSFRLAALHSRTCSCQAPSCPGHKTYTVLVC